MNAEPGTGTLETVSGKWNGGRALAPPRFHFPFPASHFPPYPTGSVSVNVEPVPTSLFTSMRPPSRVASCWEM